jgi:hypothetical protein
MAVVESAIYAEVYKFLVSSPTPQQIIDFRASEDTQVRVRELLAANRESRLTPDELAELDEFERVNHFVSMLKIYARQQLKK